MKLDLTSLSNSLESLEASLKVVGDEAWFSVLPTAVQNTLIAGVIQNFEFVHELSIKMIRRRIELDAASPTEADFANFRDLLRTAAERGMIADVEAWFGYRKLRNETSDTYDRQKAQKVFHGIPAFLRDAQALMHELQARND